MSQTHAHPDPQSNKKHGDPLESAIDSTTDSGTSGPDPVPPADNGGHAHSPAAHLESSGQPHTKPAGNLRQGSHPTALREPPMVVNRVGKGHRGE